VNVTVETLAPCKRLLRIEVDSQAVDKAFDETTASYQREAGFPAFARESPAEMITRTYAKEIEKEVKKKVMSDAYRSALEEQKLRVIGYPDIEEITFARGQALQFAATVETAPEFELPEYKGLPVKIEARSVTETDIERALDVLRTQRATYNDVARPVQTGDFVVVSYTGTCDGKPITETAPTAAGLTTQKDFWVHVEKDSFIPGFSEQLVGASAGDKRTVSVDFPAEFVTPQLAGKKGVYDVEIVRVKERVLPEMSDVFAQTLAQKPWRKCAKGCARICRMN
jgi:trigger factor